MTSYYVIQVKVRGGFRQFIAVAVMPEEATALVAEHLRRKTGVVATGFLMNLPVGVKYLGDNLYAL
jgi:hypothetical protein